MGVVDADRILASVTMSSWKRRILREAKSTNGFQFRFGILVTGHVETRCQCIEQFLKILELLLSFVL